MVVLAVPVLAGPARAAQILAVRVWPADEYTRITIESDGALVQRHFLAEGPDRLVIEIDGLELDATLRELVGKVRADDPAIERVRVGQNRPGTVRLVIDLKRATAPQVFALAPVAAYRHRLVFDLRPVQEIDPLLELIRDKEAAEREAAGSVRDALGEFIGRVEQGASAPRLGAASPPSPATSTAVAVSPPAAAPVVTPSGTLAAKVDRLVVVAIDPDMAARTRVPSGPPGCARRTSSSPSA
jgi:N-acetylmuramoyl-L-alanine amidase